LHVLYDLDDVRGARVLENVDTLAAAHLLLAQSLALATGAAANKQRRPRRVMSAPPRCALALILKLFSVAASALGERQCRAAAGRAPAHVHGN
jgi:hypothetical protein